MSAIISSITALATLEQQSAISGFAFPNKATTRPFSKSN